MEVTGVIGDRIHVEDVGGRSVILYYGTRGPQRCRFRQNGDGKKKVSFVSGVRDTWGSVGRMIGVNRSPDQETPLYM